MLSSEFSIKMNNLFFLLVVVVIGTQCEEAVVHKYNAVVFEKIQKAAQEAENIIQEAKTATKDEKRYLYDQANDYYHYLSDAIYILNIAVYSEHLQDASKKELTDLTKELSESASSVLHAINKADLVDIKNNIKVSIELAKNKIQVLSRIASEVDKVSGGKVVEYYINQASTELQRGFYQIKSRHIFFGKTPEQLENHVNATGVKARTEINEVSGDGKTIATTLRKPIANVVNFVGKVLQRIDELLYNEESIPNAAAIRDHSNKLMNLYGELVQLRVQLGSIEDGVKLKQDLINLSDKATVLFKELVALITGDTGKKIIEDILPQTETGVQFLFFYLELAKQKQN